MGVAFQEFRGGISATGQELLARIESLLPQLRARASEEEAQRRLSDATIADLRDCGFIRMHVPKSFGGSNLGLAEHFEAARLLARGAASTAWVGSFLAQGAIYVRKFAPEVQARVFSDPDYNGTCGSNQAHPGSMAVPVDGGYLLSGRWGFTSGIQHATWTTLSVGIETPPGAPPARLFCLVPVTDVEICDVWFTAGMRATGSNDVVLKDYFVPHDYALTAEVFAGDQSPGALAEPGNLLTRCPVYRIATIAHPAFALGAAERAFEVFGNLIQKRQRYWGGGALIEAPTVHMLYALAVRDLRIARLLAEDMVARTVAGLDTGYTMEDRAYLTLSSAACIDAAGKVVQELARRSGGSMHFTGHELDRVLRDMSVILNHSTGDLDYAAESVGSVMLGKGLGRRIEIFF